MPELPEVEVLVRHLDPLLRGRTINRVIVRRAKSLRGVTPAGFKRVLSGARFGPLSRRGKYLLFELQRPGKLQPTVLIGHLGMTGRMFLSPREAQLPKHFVVAIELGRQKFVFEDPRYFGGFTLNPKPVAALGPEPLSDQFTPRNLGAGLERSRQAIKVKLLDQSLVAGIGNIYACEALFRARLSPWYPSNRLRPAQVKALWRAIRSTLGEAVRGGSTLTLNFSGTGERTGLFYFGRAPGSAESYQERLRVYGREGQPCVRCGTLIRRITQGARSSFFCPQCQAK